MPRGYAAGKIPDHAEVDCDFRTEVCSKAKNPTRALQWIKEIEAAKSLDDLISTKSISGKDFPDYEELDLMMASALQRCHDKQTRFRKKISVEEQWAQKDNRFLRGRQIAYLIYEYFRPTGSYDEIQGLSWLFSIKLENDDIQDFDLRWEQALLLTSDPPSDKVLEGLYVSKLQDSFPVQTIMALFSQEILRRGGQRDYHRLRMRVKLHVGQTHRSKKFRIQSEISERVAVTEGKGQNSFTKRKTGWCFQWKANGSCSKGDSCSFLHSRTSGNRETSAEEVKNTEVSSLRPAVNNDRRRKGKEQASSSVPTGKGQTDDKRDKSEARPATGAKIPCLWRARCGRSSCDFRHPPVCRNYKSGTRCIHGKNCLYRHADGEEKPSKRSKSEGTQGAVAILTAKKVQGCVSHNSDPKKSILRKAGQTRLNATKFSGRTWYEIQIRERKGHLEALSRKVNLMSEILARPSLGRERLRKPQVKKGVPVKQHGIWRAKIYKL